MAGQICSHCGYEGRGKHVGPRSGGGIARVMGILTMLPFYTLWSMGGKRGGKTCPHCGMPTMVKATSEAGKLVRRRIDIELGLITVKKPEEKKEEKIYAPSLPKVETVAKKPVNPDEW